MTSVTNLLADLPSASNVELTTDMVSGNGVRLERIVSFGQASPKGFWYDQHEAARRPRAHPCPCGSRQASSPPAPAHRSGARSRQHLQRFEHQRQRLGIGRAANA